MSGGSLYILCSYFFPGSSKISFGKKIYHNIVLYEDVQERRILSSVELSRNIMINETISYSEVVDSNQFVFNENTLSIMNSESLDSGRYEFLIVLIIDSVYLSAVIVIDVLSQSK